MDSFSNKDRYLKILDDPDYQLEMEKIYKEQDSQIYQALEDQYQELINQGGW
jgi:hypothetical protein